MTGEAGQHGGTMRIGEVGTQLLACVPTNCDQGTKELSEGVG
jgi:hypothetical protein